MDSLKYLLELPFHLKIKRAENRIKEWHRHWNGSVYVAFSGGKDSTVLLHLVRKLFPKTKAVFCDTGLEYPQIRKFVKTINNVIWLKPKMNFKQVISKYGFPVVSKEVSQKIYEIRNTKSKKLLHKRLYGDDNRYHSGRLPKKWKFLIDAPFKISHNCCNVFKKNISHSFEKSSGLHPFLGTRLNDSDLRKQSYLNNGCNAFNLKNPQSRPLSIWTQDDIWNYIKKCNIKYSTIYDMGYDRTGCMFCPIGIQKEKRPNRFDKMETTHPAIYKYCMNELGLGEVLSFVSNESNQMLINYSQEV